MPGLNENYKKKLINRYVAGEATEDELLAFFGLLTTNDLDLLIEEHMSLEIGSILQEKQITKNHKKNLWKYPAAAAILLLLGWGSFNLFYKTPVKQQIAKNQRYDVRPGGNKAILTLADGKKIILNGAQNGKLADQGNVIINKTGNGQLVYHAEATSNAQTTAYNFIEVPPGGQYKLTLSDGTRVWLNAASTLRYPTSFSGNERKVELTGEGYFEVVHHSKSPFRVVTKGQIVEDIGTHFNINAYFDEQSIKTTLVEGAVKVSTSGASSDSEHKATILKPGQQSSLKGSRIEIRTVDIENMIAWKNGQFNFNNDNLGNIMRQISRWYDMEVVFENEKSKEKILSGIITRSVSISELLHMLERTGEVKAKINDHKIIILDL
ncbi:FecR protein [Pedobacter steynii]|uniref:FecR protein n=1 Tax=Pedobacter steynii TaxID=430522 RepID=A0A1G9ZIL0_9SPHI|nr:FecR family protein [Pedobacter steynii]NQX40070.1 DUF4974 domain-containing protein [Pedobacter steynii]SDN20917.1 FecR protein [Pedobacter steynii]